MRSLGYTELRPPSTFLGPGAMVYVKSTDPFQAGTVCGVRASMGGNFVPRTSPTARREMRKVQGKHFELDTKVLEFIHAEARFAAIRTISVSLNNPRITELTDDMVRENARYRSDACRESIADREAAGFKVTMISSAVEGDVSYSVTWKEEAKLGAQAKIDALNQLAVTLGAGADSITENTIAAHGLIWGIIDDRWLAQKSAPLDIAGNVRPGERIIQPEHLGRIQQKPDAPVVPSQDPKNAHYRCATCTDEDMQSEQADNNFNRASVYFDAEENPLTPVNEQ
jgi:hypothetical protein